MNVTMIKNLQLTAPVRSTKQIFNQLKLGLFFFALSLVIYYPSSLVQSAEPKQAISLHGAPKYPNNFSNFDYVNPAAPKGGTLKLAGLGTFDTFNPFLSKGVAADYVDLIYDHLTTASLDESFSRYPLLAKSIELDPNYRFVTYHLREEAKFHDGHPIRAEDVVFSFNLLKTQGRPEYRYYYAGIESVKALNELTVRFNFKAGVNRELALIVGELPILPKHFWSKRDFSKADLSIPLGSGPYKIKTFQAGRQITFERVKDYWGANLPVNRGRYNVDKIVYDYYLDPNVALEAFKAGEYDLRIENNSKYWATLYNGKAFAKGLIKKELIPHQQPAGMQGFVFNLRRPLFQDIALRKSMAKAFDFAWANQNLFYGQYNRTESFYQNTELAATGAPSAEELKLLTPFKSQLAPEVFQAKTPLPSYVDQKQLREALQQAAQELKNAGYSIAKNQLISPSGKAVVFSFLTYDSAFDRILLPYKKNLAMLGIQMNIQRVDSSQYIRRLRHFDFDVIIHTYGQSLSPGNEQREFWHSKTAEIPDSRNMAGLKNPVVDHLVEKLIQSPTRQDLIIRTRALDRVLTSLHLVVPNWYMQTHRLAYYSQLKRPAKIPPYGLDLHAWWIESLK
jgi:microcin C transport system substrate-binding protein